ncbi:unnamed protein product [Lymnaea stagnalis]|uniref:Uncharacterized protein n=1 Tax=Lymnaea stagnalis TaxID=6523 RepID=A0AAV2HTV9_LYMST
MATKTSMTSWAGHDPLQKFGNTDHWTKMKLRAEKQRGLQSAIGQRSGDNINTESQADLFGISPDLLCNTGRSQTFISSKPKKNALENCYHKKAKEGFRYWDIYRPKPTKFGKYGIGSYKMVLGLGAAPRT